MAPSAGFVLIGGAGFVGTAVTRQLLARGCEVVVVDRARPTVEHTNLRWVQCDLLSDELDPQHLGPAGHIVLLAGNSDPRPRWPWTLPLDNAITTARLLPVLRGRTVTLVSSVEIYGAAAAPLSETTPPVLPVTDAVLAAWCVDATIAAAAGPCPPWRVAALCRRLADADPTGRWVYALSKLAQEWLVRSVVRAEDLCVLRLANTVGAGQDRVVTRLIRSALRQHPMGLRSAIRRSFLAVDDVAGLLLNPLGEGTFNIGLPPVSLGELAVMVGRVCGAAPVVTTAPAPDTEHCGELDTARAVAAGLQLRSLGEAIGDVAAQIRDEPLRVLEPAIPVVIPPRPARPDVVADRQQQALWTGLVKHGNRWSSELSERLRVALDLADDDDLLVTKSGTYALRLAVAATVGPADPGDVAILPSFTYRATADVLVQFGYTLRYVDVDPWSWTLDPIAVEVALRDERVRVVVSVDTFGNPCSYQALAQICANAAVPLVADSAAALGSSYAGVPVGGQADAHAFSMSFAKTLTAAGAGGAVVMKAGVRTRDPYAWLASSLIDEVHSVAALDQLDLLPELVERRNAVARRYREVCDRLDSSTHQGTYQGVSSDNVHSYVHWVVAAPRRDRLARELARRGVQTKPYFPAQHLHHEISAPGLHLPVTERLDRHALALPMSSELSQAQVDALAEALEEAFITSAKDRQPHDAGSAARRLRSPAYRVVDSDARES